MVPVSDVALYFPYVNLPSDAWVKAAALHWLQLGRIRPRRYGDVQDSDTVKQLKDEFDFIVDVKPRLTSGQPPDGDDLARNFRARWWALEEQLDAMFFDFLDRYSDELRSRYGRDACGAESLYGRDAVGEPQSGEPRWVRVHVSKMTLRLVRRLADEGLLILREDPRSIVMHHRLAHVYLAVLANLMARENGMTPLTDQPLTCAGTSGWTIDAMAQILLYDEAGTASEEPADYSHVFAALALQTIVPRDLAEVPVERIIEARRRLLPDLMRYRDFLDSLVPDFVEISEVLDPEVRAARLRNHVESQIAQPIETMERELGRLGLQPVRAVLSLQTLAPPTALGLLADTLHAPSLVTGAGVVAGCLVGATSSALVQRRQVLAGHPAGYLLSLRQELSPSDTVAQIRSAVRRAAPRRRRRGRLPGMP